MLGLFQVGDAVALAATLVLVGSLIAALAFPNRQRLAWSVVSLSLLISFLVDQHRLQPWAYQMAIYAIAFATIPAIRARSWLMVLAASIYIYSAAGKFDFQFTHTVGQDFLNTIATPFGGLPVEWDLSKCAKIALLFPIGELVVGIGLLLPWTRRLAAPAAMLMHAILLAILGPWGLGHSNGVLVWNVALMFQAYFLVMKPAPTEDDQTPSRFSIVAYGTVAIALLAPLSERYGYWDHWTSWALYSPHNSRVEIQIHESAIERLPAEVQEFVEDDTDGDSWRALNVGDWSLNVRKVPVYPQARYQLELAREVADRYDLQDAIRAEQQSVSDRWTGRREESRFIGQTEIEKALWRVPLQNPRSPFAATYRRRDRVFSSVLDEIPRNSSPSR